nr:unnamed protein product [Callosobruchus chinensis]
MFLNNLSSSKSAPGIMAAGNYVHSSTQHEGTAFQHGGGSSFFRPQHSPAVAEHSHPVPSHTQTIAGPDKQCGHLTANIFIQTPNKVTSAMTTSTDSFDGLKETSETSKPYASNHTPGSNYETCRSKERLEPQPCPSQPSRVSYKPSAPPESCKVHCSKCCELASGNRRPSLLTTEELERIKMKFMETKIKLNNLIKCTTPRNARSANPIACSGGQSYTNSFASGVSSNTSGPCQTCDVTKQQSHHHYP